MAEQQSTSTSISAAAQAYQQAMAQQTADVVMSDGAADSADPANNVGSMLHHHIPI